MKKIFVVLITLISVSIFGQSLESPNGDFQLEFSLKNGVPYYNLKYKGEQIINDSKLGFEIYKETTYNF